MAIGMSSHRPRIIGLLWQRRLPFLLAAATSASIAITLGARLERTYVAEAQLTWRGRPPIAVRGVAAASDDTVMTAAMVHEHLLGADGIAGVTQRLGASPTEASGKIGRGLDRTTPFSQADVAQMTRRVTVAPVTGDHQSGQFVVTCTGAHPQLVAEVTDAVLASCMQRTHHQVQQAIDRHQQRLHNQVGEYHRQLEQAEANRIEFEAGHGGMEPDAPTRLEAKIIELSVKLEQIGPALEVLIHKRLKLRQWVEGEPKYNIRSTEGANPELEPLLKQKRALEEKKLTLMTTGGKMKPTHPTIKAINRQIARLQKKADATQGKVEVEGQKVPNAQRVEALRDIELYGGEIAALEKQQAELHGQIEKLELQKQQMVPARREHAKLVRAYGRARDGLDAGEQRLAQFEAAVEKARAGRSDDWAWSAIAVPGAAAPADGRLVYPTQTQIVAGSATFGLVSGFVLVVLISALDGRIRHRREIEEEMQLTVLGSVDEFESPATRRWRRLWRWCGYPSVTAVMIAMVALAVVDATRQYAEAEVLLSGAAAEAEQLAVNVTVSIE